MTPRCHQRVFHCASQRLSWAFDEIVPYPRCMSGRPPHGAACTGGIMFTSRSRSALPSIVAAAVAPARGALRAAPACLTLLATPAVAQTAALAPGSALTQSTVPATPGWSSVAHSCSRPWMNQWQPRRWPPVRWRSTVPTHGRPGSGAGRRRGSPRARPHSNGLNFGIGGTSTGSGSPGFGRSPRRGSSGSARWPGSALSSSRSGVEWARDGMRERPASSVPTA